MLEGLSDLKKDYCCDNFELFTTPIIKEEYKI